MAGLDLIASAVCNTTKCEIVYDNPVVNSHLTKIQEDYINLTKYINGKHLVIGTYESFPLSGVEKTPNGTLIGVGVAFTIIEILQKRFNFTYEVVEPENNFEFNLENSNAESLVKMLQTNQIDMAAAFLPTLSDYYNKITYSTDLDEGVWMMLLKRPKASAAGSGLMAPFNGLVWYMTLIAVLSYGPCISFLTRLRSKLIQDKDHPLPLSPSCWFVYSAFIKQGTNLSPEANATRILFATWWLFIILLSAFYTANLTAFLTLSKFTLDIDTPQDLAKKNYKWISSEGGSVQHVVLSENEDLTYLKKMITNGRAEFHNYPSITQHLKMVDDGAVLVKESVAIDYIMYGDYLHKTKQGITETDRCTYVVAHKPFMTKQRAFAYPLGSPLKNLFDPILLRFLQSGIIDFLSHRDLPSTKICPLDLQSKDRQLRNSDLIMTYLIMATGLAAAAAAFIGEVLFKRYFQSKICCKKEDKKVKFKRNKNRFPKRFDDSRPPPYDSLFGNRYNINENSKKVINGTEYYISSANGKTRLIPVRTPSAILFR